LSLSTLMQFIFAGLTGRGSVNVPSMVWPEERKIFKRHERANNIKCFIMQILSLISQTSRLLL